MAARRVRNDPIVACHPPADRPPRRVGPPPTSTTSAGTARSSGNPGSIERHQLWRIVQRVANGEDGRNRFLPWFLDPQQLQSALQDVVDRLCQWPVAEADGVSDAGGAPPRGGVVPTSVAIVRVHDPRPILQVLDARPVEARVNPEEERPRAWAKHSRYFGESRRQVVKISVYPDRRYVVERTAADRESGGIRSRHRLAGTCVPQLILRDVDADDLAARRPKDLCVQAGTAPEVEAQPLAAAEKIDQRVSTEVGGWSGRTFVPVATPSYRAVAGETLSGTRRIWRCARGVARSAGTWLEARPCPTCPLWLKDQLPTTRTSAVTAVRPTQRRGRTCSCGTERMSRSGSSTPGR